jgi:hypothetical protein
MKLFNHNIGTKIPGPQIQTTLLFLILCLPLLAGCDILTKEKLEIYNSNIVNVKFPILAGWEVQVEQTAEEDVAYLTMKNNYSGVLVTRAPLALLFPDQGEGADIEIYLNTLADISQGTFANVGTVEEQRRSGYRQAIAPIELDQVGDMSEASTGTLLLAIQDDQAVIAIFYCTNTLRDLCEEDLAKSVKGFRLNDIQPQ